MKVIGSRRRVRGATRPDGSVDDGDPMYLVRIDVGGDADQKPLAWVETGEGVNAEQFGWEMIKRYATKLDEVEAVRLMLLMGDDDELELWIEDAPLPEPEELVGLDA